MDDRAEVTGREAVLREAMLAGDAATLATLLDDRLVFTGPDGTVLTKAEDLAAHQTGLLRLQRLDLFDTSLHAFGDIVVATAKARLAGWFGETAIDGVFAYTRLWSRVDGEWVVLAGHASRIG